MMRVFDETGREIAGEEDAEVRDAASLLNDCRQQCIGAGADDGGEGAEREQDLALDLQDPQGQDATGLEVLIKSKYKSRHGQLKHPTKYLGVWRTFDGLYKSCIWNGKRAADGRRRYKLGLYRSARDAALAYDRAAIAIKGDLALTNFPPPPNELRQNAEAVRHLLEAKAATDSEGSDNEEWVGCDRSSPAPIAPLKKRCKRAETQGGEAGESGGGGEDDVQVETKRKASARYIGVWRKAQVHARAHAHAHTHAHTEASEKETCDACMDSGVDNRHMHTLHTCTHCTHAQ
jgi:hypothetical protein